MNIAPVVQDVVLVGGGHSHVIFIRMWAMQAIPGVRLTLISEKVDTPYSGMLPGLIAGHYSEEEVHIDLARLCSWARVRFITSRVEQIDLLAKCIHVNDTRPPIGFDVLSLDTGSTPELSVSGSERFSVPVKPVHGFYARWLSLLNRIDGNEKGEHDNVPANKKKHGAGQTSAVVKKVSLGVVGSGAGGFELVMAMRHALQSDIADCHWFVRDQHVLKGRPEKVSDRALQAAERAGVVIHKGFDVVDVKQNELVSRDSRSVSLDEIVWCAAAKAPDWPKQAGLDVDSRGFVFTNAHLQSVSHHFVFATGDIGTQQETPSAKAGVFAVRQAPVLFQNIRRYLLGTSLKVYQPQTDFLSLMATGGKSAIGNRGNVTLEGDWVWRWKNVIDQKFMDRFRKLPQMKLDSSLATVPQALLKQSSLSAEDVAGAGMRCRGCGGKVGGTILDAVLQDLELVNVAGVVEGLDIAGDAAVINTAMINNSAINASAINASASNPAQTVNSTLVQSVDQISAVTDDPYLFGRIAAVHALSDVVAAGAKPHSAQAIVSLPFADKRIVERDLRQLMAGAVDALNEDGCALIGGHTAEASELSLGFVVNGFMLDDVQDNADNRSNSDNTKGTDSTIVAGDLVILTKPIGSGILLAGMMRQQAKGLDVQAVLTAMQQSNRIAAQILYTHGASAVTDVTGFGLLGHLHRLLARWNSGAALQVSTVALYDGVQTLAQRGIGSTLLLQNQHVLQQLIGVDSIDAAMQNILCDPQTSGGLLGVVSATESDAVLTDLHRKGCEHACVIGTITESSGIQLSA